LEYNSEAGPSKYLIGTEQGVVLMVNLKNRKQNNGITVFDQGPGSIQSIVYFKLELSKYTNKSWNCTELIIVTKNTIILSQESTTGQFTRFKEIRRTLSVS
jgi:hypothetical protein